MPFCRLPIGTFCRVSVAGPSPPPSGYRTSEYEDRPVSRRLAHGMRRTGMVGDCGGEQSGLRSKGQTDSLAGRGTCAPCVIRVGSGEPILADPIWPPPTGVPGRCTGQQLTLDPADVSTQGESPNRSNSGDSPCVDCHARPVRTRPILLVDAVHWIPLGQPRPERSASPGPPLSASSYGLRRMLYPSISSSERASHSTFRLTP